MPKLLIVQASAYRSFADRRPYRIRKRKLIGAVLPYLAALAPPDWDVTLTDDALEEPNYDGGYDVVAISVRTVTSLRAYEIAATFRQRNVPVIMGGPHATFWHEEMAEHADAVCIGEAEEIFPRMLAGRRGRPAAEALPARYRCRPQRPSDATLGAARPQAPRVLRAGRHPALARLPVHLRLLRRAPPQRRLRLSRPPRGGCRRGDQTQREPAHLLRRQPVRRQQGAHDGAAGGARSR